MKTLRALVVTLLAAAVLAVSAAAAEQTLRVRDAAGVYQTRTVRTVALELDGAPLETDLPAFILGGRTLVPVRVVSEALHATVNWKQETQQVQIENGRTAVTLTIGSAEAVVNGQPVALYSGIPATLAQTGDGLTRTLVPLRFVSEQLGASVDFDDAASTVRITSAPARTYAVSAPQLQDGVLTVQTTETDPDAAAEASIFTLPGRVVADFPGGVLEGASSGSLAVDGTAVHTVRFNQYDQGYGAARVARVVLDLREGCTIDDLTLDFSGGVLTVVQPEPPAVPEPEPEPPAEPTEPEPPAAPLVVLDAGHGGTDIGAPYYGLYEKDLTLPITLETGRLLEAAGLRVAYTRSDDTYVSLAARAEQANIQQAAVFVSIHANAFLQKPEVHGLETYHFPGDAASRALAGQIHSAVLAAAGAADREIRTAHFYVLEHTEMPAVLVETGYMTNEAECARLAAPEYRARLAQGVAGGILAYLGES